MGHPVARHQSTYQTPVSSLHAIGSEYKVANQTHLGSEHSFSNEPQNPATSNRVLLPIEPEFSQMSDPSIIIDQPSNTWRSNDRRTSQRRSRRDQPKRKHKSGKRRRHRSPSSPPLLDHSLQFSKMSKQSHKRRRR